MVYKTIARTPPPAFLFPNQQCQRPELLQQPHRLTPGGRRRRVSSRLDLSCQSSVSGCFRLGPKPESKDKITPRPPEGLPHEVRCDSIELRKIVAKPTNSKRRFRLKLCSPAPVSERGRLLSPLSGMRKGFLMPMLRESSALCSRIALDWEVGEAVCGQPSHRGDRQEHGE